MRAKRACLIGAVFGLVYVLVNAGELPSGAAIMLRALGIITFAVVLLSLRASGRGRQPVTPPRGGFGRGYWLVVAAEVVAGVAGLVVLNGSVDVPKANVAWISFVVGVHFFGLAALWREPFYWWLGLAITACGVAGLILSLAGSSAGVIATVSGIGPGAVLLAAAWLGARRMQGYGLLPAG